ncbi:hypothetical protein AVEN_190060-1 [Araneus ventricosus]|uniref:Uncharacterized protein n=1 Tax=Araneus ventricosus TaxID=182803 RepID=A0A4Y2MTG2_ARAVE|nr:hypothetical protein AVEN_190060-1 [Araneus ventricosus]
MQCCVSPTVVWNAVSISQWSDAVSASTDGRVSMRSGRDAELGLQWSGIQSWSLPQWSGMQSWRLRSGLTGCRAGRLPRGLGCRAGSPCVVWDAALVSRSGHWGCRADSTVRMQAGVSRSELTGCQSWRLPVV